jgi:uncharacterized protein YecT (DUF1311 family)
LVLGIGLIVPSTSAQSNCDKPVSTAEEQQCADQELATAEAGLKEALETALRRYSHSKVREDIRLPKSDEHQQAQYEARMRHTLIASQKAWLQYRESACNSVAEMYEGGTATGPAVASCRTEMTRERAKFLRDYFGETQ